MKLVFLTSDIGCAPKDQPFCDALEQRIREALASGQPVECVALPVGVKPVVVDVPDLPRAKPKDEAPPAPQAQAHGAVRAEEARARPGKAKGERGN